MRAILEERRDFDGVCCLNDPIAIGALTALTDAGSACRRLWRSSGSMA